MTEPEMTFRPRGFAMQSNPLLARQPIPYQQFPVRVGRWTVLSHEGRYSDDGKNLYWPCRCDCGTERMVAAKNLRSGTSRSCSCLRNESLRKKFLTHGLSRTVEYRRFYNVTHWAKYLLLKAKASARKLGLPCNLQESDIIVPDTCPVLGIPLKAHMEGRAWNTPTLDRIDPKGGYVKGNVVVVSWRANRLKCDASLAEIEAIFNFYVRDLKGET